MKIPVVVTVQALDSNGTPVSTYAGPVVPTPVPADGVTISTSTQANGQFAVSVVFPKTGKYTITVAEPVKTASSPRDFKFDVKAEDHDCFWFPIRSKCNVTIPQVNAFFTTNSSLSYFNQVKSIYNGASGSATVSADIATLNFLSGMQFTATTNIQAGPSNAPPQTPNTGWLATLSSTEAAQAAQNMLYGGTAVVSMLYPVIGVVTDQDLPGNLGFSLDFVAREGVETQASGGSVHSCSRCHPRSTQAARAIGSDEPVTVCPRSAQIQVVTIAVT
jgi:hypothetical protein